jgi:hypothetical protein
MRHIYIQLPMAVCCSLTLLACGGGGGGSDPSTGNNTPVENQTNTIDSNAPSSNVPSPTADRIQLTGIAVNPQKVRAGYPATFKAQGTMLGDATYSWNFGDGTAQSTDKEPAHTFQETGTYNVRLNATDMNGYPAYVDTSVTVIVNTPPSIWNLQWPKASPDPFEYVNEPINMHSCATDLEGDKITYSWETDEGYVTAGTPSWSGIRPDTGQSDYCYDAPITFKSVGKHTVKITVSDPYGGTFAHTWDIQVHAR